MTVLGSRVPGYKFIEVVRMLEWKLWTMEKKGMWRNSHICHFLILRLSSFVTAWLTSVSLSWFPLESMSIQQNKQKSKLPWPRENIFKTKNKSVELENVLPLWVKSKVRQYIATGWNVRFYRLLVVNYCLLIDLKSTSKAKIKEWNPTRGSDNKVSTCSSRLRLDRSLTLCLTKW